MSQDLKDKELSLRDQVGRSEQELDALQEQLRGIEAELRALADEHYKYELLGQACASLERLEEAGAAQLFWGTLDNTEGADRLRRAHIEIDEYHAEIARVEERRDAMLDRIGNANLALDYLHYDLQDIIEAEESRKNEWIPEREESEVPFRAQIMPWARGTQEDERFRRSLGSSLAASLAVAAILSMIAIPIKTRDQEIELPDRVARLVRQEQAPPPPPPPLPEPEPVEEEPPEPEEQLVDEAEPEPIPEVTEKPQVAEAQPDTREQVKQKGILAFRDSFANRAEVQPTANLGSQARIRQAGEEAVGRPERMMVSTSAPGSSGGINLAEISRDFGGGGGDMQGVAVTRVASSIGGGEGPDRPLAAGASAGRTDEEIQIVFDRYKAALYRLYNRELRKDPTLRGQLVLRLTIEPDGSVSLCELHSSTMDAPVLAGQVVDRVQTFDFGAKEDIVAITIIYPIDFLPSA
ncbi:MAG: AgmX/PglI C-terminal domain-containing protein [Woeseiaceae bacterium]|nr:AgmX/PglI C-terminal domain-containing protein [Woeseiaceae bacterium]